MRKRWLLGLVVLAVVPARAQMTQVSALVMDTNDERYVNCQWSVVFQNQNTIPGAGPSQPAALLVGQQGNCDSSGNLNVSLADNVNTIRPTPSQWRFSICSAPGYVPGGTYCRSNMLVTITGATQDLTSFFQPLMPLLPTGGGGGGGGGYITDATPLGGLMKTGSTLGLQTTCVAGQYLGWTGSAWACTGAGVGGGTSVTVNGTAAVPNQLNFTNSLLPPAGSTVVNFLLNGNTVGAYVTGTGGGGGSLTVNGGTGGSDLNDRLPQFPPNGINISWQAANGHISGAIVGDGIATHCFLGSGVFAQCPGGGGGGAGVSSINGVAGAFNFTGAVSCSGTTCNFTGGGAGGLPTIPAWNLFASTGSGGAQDSGVGAEAGFVRAQVLEASGATGNAPSGFTPPNGSIEYFPTGGYGIGGPNGLAIHFSHSSVTNGTAPGYGNGGIALGGGNATGYPNNPYQIYLDCESAPLGCDFKVPISVNGSSVGGGVSSINGTPGAFTFSGAGVSCASTTCTFGGGGGSGTVSSGALGHFTWYAAAGTTVTSNANLDDSVTTAATITSQETIAAPQINVNGATGTGIAMTGVGGTLPSVPSGSGGVGIGPGGVPQYNANGAGWVNIGSGGAGGGVTSINGTAGAFTFSGSGVSCATTTCTFSGTGSGATLPTIAVTNLYASNGSGGAQDTGVQATSGFIKSNASIVNGTAASSPFTGANASQEWYGAGGTVSGVTFPNGAALFIGHGASTAGNPGNGGIALGGGSATPTQQIYLDCEVAGCDFKVPLTYNGAAIGGGGGTAGSPNQTVSFTNATTASLTSTTATSALVWACWDNNTPVNAIYPSNVTLNPSTFTITFTFTMAQSGFCAINGTGAGPHYSASLSGTSWSIPAATHNLGPIVNVRTYDSAGNEIFGNTLVDATGNVTVSWLMAQAGKVVISQ